MPDSSPALGTAAILGQMAGEYRLRRKLGEGGFGAVYEAEHPVLKRRAAVKVLHQVAGLDSDAVMRFISEAQAVNQIKSDHIIDVFSFGRLGDGRHFFVMDYLDGEPLDRYLMREKRLEVGTALRLLRPIVEALDAAHAAGIVHRDLKPQNVFLTWDAHGDTVPKLLDFGMAKLLSESPVRTASGTPMGTPLYMSPEQTRGEKVDGRSDIYSLGVLCYEMLTGRLPITGESTIAVLVAQLTQPAPRISDARDDLPRELDEPLLRMLEKDASARPATAGAALEALIRAVESTGVVVPPGLPKLPMPPRSELPEVGAAFELGSGAPSATPISGQAGSARSTYPAVRGRDVLAAVLGSIALLGGATYLVGRWMAAPLVAPSELQSAAGQSAASIAPIAPAAASAAASVTGQPVLGSAVATNPTLVPPVEAVPTSVGITLRGPPAGAEVWLGDKLLGKAPGPVEVAFGRSTIELTVSAEGHEPFKLALVPDHALELEVELKKLPRPSPNKRAQPRTGGTGISSDLENPF